jgi:NAD-dependent DNA ligase/DNA polymerase/3'-5' exonuclease PolX
MTPEKLVPEKLVPEKLVPEKLVPEKLVPEKRWNEDFIAILAELADIMQRQGEPFKSRAYQKAQETIITYEKDIQTLDQIADLPGIGKTIASKLDEFMKTGTLRILERERSNPVNLLTKVYGIGPKKADELVKTGIKSIADLRAHPELLNDVQKIGLNYFEAIETRIPREEIDVYKQLFTRVFQESTPTGSRMEIVGSYRRGAPQSGDIDIIITNQSNDSNAMKQFMDRLIREKIVIEVLSRGKTKSLTVAQLPGAESIPRRVDFLYTPPTEYAFALLYFTGSKFFNTVQRHRALQLGYSLNEHGLYKMLDKKKGEKVAGEFPNEQAIFAILQMRYKEPHERIDGRAVQLITAEPSLEMPTSVEPYVPSTKIKRNTLKNKKSIKNTIVMPASLVPASLVPASLVPSSSSSVSLIKAFKAQGLAALQTWSEDQLSDIIRQSNTAYYCNKEPLFTDNEYDILREYTLDKYPDNKAALEGHTESQCATTEKNKVKLPYEMWSMDKIKPDTTALEKWKQIYKGPYVISRKLDGVSGLYSTEGPKPKLYTRGNGLVGQDISHLLPYLRLPKVKDCVVRGEFIVAKAVFQTKYSQDFANPRNFVAGLINQKKPDPLKCADIDFVVYEVLKPVLKPSAQMAYLEKARFNTVQYMTTATLSNQFLSDLLIAWRAASEYEIDGIICINDVIYPRQTGNPAHAFAFKMVLSDQIAEAKVVGVIWTASKDGYLKPRVQIEPLQLGGVKIEYATGFNAKFIEENKIGLGALIRLTRSGDVIPHIVAVVQPAAQPQMPLVPYIWNSTHVDIMLENKGEDETVKEKNIAYFFTNLDVDGLGPGNAKKIIAAGFDTVPKILAMGEADFLKVAGFKQKMAIKIKASIEAQVQKATLPELMHATNLFGRGFGVKKFQLILAAEPTLLTADWTVLEKVKRVAAIEGMAKKTAEQFVTEIPVFLAFLMETHLENKLQEPLSIPTGDMAHPLYGKKIILTGFRDKGLLEKLAAVGAEQGSAVSKNTFAVLVKDLEVETSKTAEAKAYGIPILSVEAFITKYQL